MSTPYNVNVPYQVTIAADGTVSVQTIDAQAYTLPVPDAVFNGFLVDDILNAFDASGNGTSPIANLSVTMVDGSKNTFVQALARQLTIAQLDGSSNDLTRYLLNWANQQLLADLCNNGIAVSLEAGGLDDLKFNDISANYHQGATDMFDGLNALTPNVLSVVGTQIPNSKWLSAFNKQVKGAPAHRLPLYDGADSMTFQFVITQNFIVSEDNQNVNGAAAASGFPLTAAADGGARGVAPVTAIGHYGVPQRVINLVLTRPSPSEYVAISDYKTKSDTATAAAGRDGAPPYVVFQFELAAARTAVTGAGTVVSNTTTAYNDAVTDASSATAAWSTASTQAVDLSGAYDNFETAVSQYNAALAVQTSALAAAGSDIAGALYDAAQRAITATKAALAYLRQCTTGLKTASVNLSGDMEHHADADGEMAALLTSIDISATAVTISGDIAAVNTAVGTYMVEFKTRVAGLHGTAVTNSDAVLTKYKAYIDAAKAEAEAKAALDNINDRYDLFLDRYEATKESADDAFDVAEAQHISAWTDTSDALVRSAALDSSAYLAVQDWSGAVVTTAEKQGIYDTTPSQANADALAAAQAAQNNKYLLAQAAVTKYKNYLPVKAAAHAALTTAYYVYISAKNADAPSTPSDFPNPKYGDLTNDIDTHTLSTMEPFASA
jgi:hypothetical protein